MAVSGCTGRSLVLVVHAAVCVIVAVVHGGASVACLVRVTAVGSSESTGRANSAQLRAVAVAVGVFGGFWLLLPELAAGVAA